MVHFNAHYIRGKMGREYCIVDFEATGGNHRVSRIMDVGLYVLKDGQIVDKFSTLVNPNKPIDAYVKKLTGIDDSMVADAPTFEELSSQLQALLKDRVFVAHNVSFDYNLLAAEFRRVGVRLAEDRLCTLELSRKLINEVDTHSLGNVSKHLGIEINDRHRAAGDALATTQLLKKLETTDGFQEAHDALLISKHFNEFEQLKSEISGEKIDVLPDDPGLFFLHDKLKNVVFVDRSQGLRDKAIQVLNGKSRGKKLARHLSEIHDITHELTGSTLLAELRYYESVFNIRPRFNENLKQLFYRYCLAVGSASGFKYAGIFRMDEAPKVRFDHFKDYKSAEKRLRKLASKYKLRNYQLHFDLKSKKRLSQKAPADEKEANKRVATMLATLTDLPEACLIIENGRKKGEKSAVWLQDQSLMGWGYFNESEELNYKAIVDRVEPKTVTDGTHIVKRYLEDQKNPTLLFPNGE